MHFNVCCSNYLQNDIIDLGPHQSNRRTDRQAGRQTGSSQPASQPASQPDRQTDSSCTRKRQMSMELFLEWHAAGLGEIECIIGRENKIESFPDPSNLPVLPRPCFSLTPPTMQNGAGINWSVGKNGFSSIAVKNDVHKGVIFSWPKTWVERDCRKKRLGFSLFFIGGKKEGTMLVWRERPFWVFLVLSPKPLCGRN